MTTDDTPAAEARERTARDDLAEVLAYTLYERSQWVREWPADEAALHRDHNAWEDFAERAAKVRALRFQKAADAIISLGWRPPTQDGEQASDDLGHLAEILSGHHMDGFADSVVSLGCVECNNRYESDTWQGAWREHTAHMAEVAALGWRPPASVIPADTRPYETQTAALDALPVHTLVSYRDHDGELHTLEKENVWTGVSAWHETRARAAVNTDNLVRNEVDYRIDRLGDGS